MNRSLAKSGYSRFLRLFRGAIVPSDLLRPNNIVRRAIWYVALLLSIWVAVWPYPYHLAIGVASLFIPLLLILVALFGRDRFQLSDADRSQGIRIELFFPLSVVIMSLAWRALRDFQSSSYDENGLRVLVFLIPLSAVMSLLVLAAIKRSAFSAALIISVFYVFSLIGHVDAIGPVKSKVSFSGSVLRKQPPFRLSGHFLIVSINNERKRVYVPKTAYDHFNIGDTVCGEEVVGWLGLYTRYLRKCEGYTPGVGIGLHES